jgi:unsaturated rhamnogalacturonyl hydrolase
LDFTLAPALPFIYRLRKNSNFKDRSTYADFVKKTMIYAEKGQIRLPNSNIYTRITPEKYTTWVDDMFMGIPFLIQAAQYAPDPQQRQMFLDDAALQILNFRKEVWDEDANLYMHARFSNKKTKFPHWSRANGWGIWATTEVLSVLPKTHKHYAAILAQYQQHVAALIKLQAKSGFWLNVLDRPDSPTEVSGTAIFTMALARGITNGWLDAPTYKPVVLKGWQALTSEIDADGTVHKICVGTMCSEDVNYYMNRPFFDDDTHGLFAVLFAANAVHTLLNDKK